MRDCGRRTGMKDDVFDHVPDGASTGVERALRERNRTLRVLSLCNRALVTAGSEAELLDRICRLLTEEGGYRAAWVGAARDDGSTVPVAAAGLAPGTIESLQVRWDDTPQAMGTSGTAIRTRAPALSHELASDPRYAPWRSLIEAHGLRTSISLPLIHGSQCFGALTLYAQNRSEIGTEEAGLLREMADDLAYGIAALRGEQARRDAQANLRLYQRVIESSSNAIVLTDARAPDHPITYVNPAFERLTGHSAADAIGRNARFLVRDLDQPGLREIRQALRRRESGHAVIELRRRDGSPVWCDLSIAPVSGEDCGVTHFVGIFVDITARVELERELAHRATHDGLTGLANRNLLYDRLSHELARARRDGSRAAVLALDLDRFKPVNDTLGHAAGDFLLKEVANRLRHAVRDEDTAARLGGDEFALVASELGAGDDAGRVAEKILAALAEPLVLEGQELSVSASIGIALFPDDAAAPEELLRCADAALYRAKEGGRNHWRRFAPGMLHLADNPLQRAATLRRALEREEFVLHYQPKLDLRSGEITGAEALIRWCDPARGMIAPADFVPLAEDTGLIVGIGQWALRSACRQLRAWHEAGLPAIGVAVNLSARQLRQETLVATIEAVLSQTGLEAKYLELELTESMVMENFDAALTAIGRLRALGVRVSLDDFGTGYSSLGYLKRFPVASLKIDRSFVRDITTDADDAAIARAVIAMAHSLQLRVVAEGVETHGQLRYLMRHGCDEIQGYLLSRPLPAADFARFLRTAVPAGLVPRAPDGPVPTLLLVDSDPGVVHSLRRLLRRDGYRIITATSAAEGLDRLAENEVQVIIAEQRMPEMSGAEFLSRVKVLHPDTVRIVLSGYTELQSVTDAINRGAIFRFLTKPWEDDQLRCHVREAFRVQATLSRSAGATPGPVPAGE